MKYIMKFVSIHQCRGACRVLRGGGGWFSRGGGEDFQKNIQKFCRPLFRSTKLIFRSTPRTLKRPYFEQKLTARAPFQKRAKNDGARFFLKKS